ncbi:hypothetical protein EDB85DRAFT_2145466 [Lactarius pseudohatsudake]|nr:hypothetical protein EDB85DRAFT_2145466 [Lactarius pseudohatsudake]
MSLLTHPRHLNPYPRTSGRVSHPLTLTSGWGGPAMHWSWELCSRSFASVVKELDNDLTRTICDLVPIEDDISILDDAQQPLRSFHEESVALNWNAMLCLLTVASLSLGFHTSIHLLWDG